jgi:hypothetical protein
VGRGRLDPLQERVLYVLAAGCSGWRLTGGAALAGFHLAHRTTRDLDLLWGGFERLDRAPAEVRAALTADQLGVATVQTAPSFHRFRVTDGRLVTVLDLMAEPVAPIEPPVPHAQGDREVLVDTPHEILVNKLCALLGRAELRDPERGAHREFEPRRRQERQGEASDLSLRVLRVLAVQSPRAVSTPCAASGGRFSARRRGFQSQSNEKTRRARALRDGCVACTIQVTGREATAALRRGAACRLSQKP